MRMLFFILAVGPLILIAQHDQSLYKKSNSAHSQWAYSGIYGPNFWSELDDEFRTCSGRLQSPIDIPTKESIMASMWLEFHYNPFLVDLMNNGHTLIEKVVDHQALKFNDINYSLLQFHFHTPSEHHIDGNEYPMEVHFVHQSTQGKYAVVAVLVEESSIENRFLAHFMGELPNETNQVMRSTERATPNECFPENPNAFFYYSGSLTTPPCTEGVNWIVLQEPVGATCDQIERIQGVIENVNRPIQPILDRLVFYAQ